MRGWLIVLLMVCMVSSLEAQQMEVNGFKRLRRPIWNRSKVAVDKQRAIIDLYTDEKGFTFTANGKEAAEATEGKGVITVKVPNKTRHITVKHPQYGTLTWRVPVKHLKRKKHYRATLLAQNPIKEYKPEQQWVVMDIEPKSAIVRMDSTVTLINEGQYAEMQSMGWHTYHVEAPFYEALTDSFLLTDTAKVNIKVKLQPAYSYVVVNTPWENGEIYIDGLFISKGEGTSRRLQEGQHRLSVFMYETCIYDQSFNIGRAEKQVITLTKNDFEPQPHKKEKMFSSLSTQSPIVAPWVASVQAPVTLKAPDCDIEIWVDREYVGTGQWSGMLAQGYHIVNTRKDSIESKSTELWIVDSTLQQLDLAVPQISMAMLNIHSNVTGAEIFINDVLVGSTPSIIPQLPADRLYTVSLRKEGYKSTKKSVRPRGNELTDLNIKMKQK